MRHGRRSAFTLIELLVVVAIVGLLAAMLLPAVQAAREAGRRLECANHLKQVGIAIHGYASAHGVLPAGQGGHSLFVSILPQLELSPLYDGLNFSDPLGLIGTASNTVRETRISTFICPSDSGNASSHGHYLNYAGNLGDAFLPPKTSSGVFTCDAPTSPRCVSLADVSDGTSSTAMVSEWLIGLYDGTIDPSRSFYDLVPSAMTAGDFFERCLARAGAPQRAPMNQIKGRDWVLGYWADNLYDHYLPINAPSCMNRGPGPVFWTCTAASGHPGGANLLFVDGHVQFVKQSIEPRVWRAVGTRRGGEVVTGDAY